MRYVIQLPKAAWFALAIVLFLALAAVLTPVPPVVAQSSYQSNYNKEGQEYNLWSYKSDYYFKQNRSAMDGPYPRHDHLDLSEDRRQRPHFRTDEYWNWKQLRDDKYENDLHPTLSEIKPDKHDVPNSLSLERVKTYRSQLIDRSQTDVNSRFGQGYFDRRDDGRVDVLDGGKRLYTPGHARYGDLSEDLGEVLNPNLAQDITMDIETELGR